MINFKDIFADFQYIGHRILNVKFNFPANFDEDNYEYDFDYTVMETTNNDDKHFGVIIFNIMIYDSEEKNNLIVSCDIEGGFVGNPENISFDRFEEMLTINGVATLSQFARSQIYNLTLMAGLPSPITIPMINVLELKNIKENSKI